MVVTIMYLFPQINYRGMPEGLIDGHLPEGKPNWVSSKVEMTDTHYIAPLKAQSLAQLSSCIESKIPEVIIKTSDASQIIAYRPSKVFHFVDWLCIQNDGAVSSSATIGYSDLGKNRELIEKIRTLCK
ncbi:DUF1499 domain-containing protein [Legionella antarctica]|nr:DUF1499 domain-containing protein [Legionella antarctica]